MSPAQVKKTLPTSVPGCLTFEKNAQGGKLDAAHVYEFQFGATGTLDCLLSFLVRVELFTDNRFYGTHILQSGPSIRASISNA